MGRFARISILIVGFVIFLSCVILLIRYGKEPGVVIQSDSVYNYQLTPSTDYKVSLIPNEYFADDVLPSGRNYIKNYVDSIVVNFSEIFQSSEKISLYGNYHSVATVTATLSDGSTLLERDYELTSETKINEVTDYMELNQEIRVDLLQYERDFQSASAQMGVVLNFTLTIKMLGTLRADTPYRSFDLPISTSVSIPLYVGMFQVTTDNSNVCSDQIIQETRTKKTISGDLIVCYILGIVLGILLILYAIFIVKPYDIEDKKKKELLKILYSNKNMMIALKTWPDADFNQIFEVKTMDMLINIAEDLNRPIFYMPDQETIVFENAFFVVHHDEIYLCHIQ